MYMKSTIGETNQCALYIINFVLGKKKRFLSDSAIIAQLRVFFENLCTISLYEHYLSKILSSLSTMGSSISVLNLCDTIGLR